MQATDTDTTGRVSRCVTRSNQRMIRQFLLIGLIAFVVLCEQHVCAADELVPPFGFRWNDSMARVEAGAHSGNGELGSRGKKEKPPRRDQQRLVPPRLQA